MIAVPTRELSGQLLAFESSREQAECTRELFVTHVATHGAELVDELRSHFREACRAIRVNLSLHLQILRPWSLVRPYEYVR